MLFECVTYILVSISIPLSYVGLIYAFDDGKEDSNHPRSLRRRFAATFVNNVLSLSATYYILKWVFFVFFLKTSNILDGLELRESTFRAGFPLFGYFICGYYSFVADTVRLSRDVIIDATGWLL